MQTRTAGVVAVMFLALAGCRTARQDPPAASDVEAGIRAAQVQMRQAAERLDATALYSHVLDTPTPIIEDGRVADTRAAALAQTENGFRRLSRIGYTYTRERITVLGPAMALWVGEGTATATLPDGRNVQAPFAESMVFAQRDGKWMVLHAHRSSP